MNFELVAGDTGSKLVVTCKDNITKLPLDLTGATVKLRYKIGLGTLQIKFMTVTTPSTAGIAEYQFVLNDLVEGILIGEVEITDSVGKIITQLTRIELPIRKKVL